MTKKKFKRIYSVSKSGCNSNCISKNAFKTATSVVCTYVANSGSITASWSRSNNRN